MSIRWRVCAAGSGIAVILVAAPALTAHGFVILPSSTSGNARESAAVRLTLDDSANAARTVERFHEALASGDSLGAMAVLASDADIAEGGEVQTSAEYHAHHLAADIAYSMAVRSVHTVVQIKTTRDAAWITSTSVTKGDFGGRPVSSAGAELMVLRKSKGQWRIEAIHWSSKRLP